MTRDGMIEALRAACEGCPDALAAFLGGSDASGRVDAWSDVDLVVIAEDGRGEATLRMVRETVKRMGPLALDFRLPEPTWHGMRQAFLRSASSPEWLMVDVCVAERSSPPTLTERERHGEPVVWFDPEGLIRVTTMDADEHAVKVGAACETARHKIALAGPLVRKALARGHVGEAADEYQRLVLAPLVTLVRAQHCPERFDFGLRYLDRDVPGDVRGRLERLAMPGGAEALGESCAECEVWAREIGGARGREPGA
ncbi:MAG: hypothetical protein DHS20C14_14230 [Phycisphaeraceae bacterium]|nr:MAG: hypothetical protein DHS20C14_14230 [Phycisphaeraceae bacterium]